MRVAVVGGGAVDEHAPSRALERRLRRAGADVSVHPHHRAGWLRGTVDAAVVVPATRGDVDLAVAAAGRGSVVHAPPQWGVPAAHDHAWAAPGSPALSRSPAGPGDGRHVEPAGTAVAPPTPARHDGVRLAIVARWTAATPARYLADGLEDAGVTVQRLEALDHDAVTPDTAGIVVVESPLPAFPVRGNASCPVLLWAHHGEHHTAVQARLVARYAADAVLLAHSWHLAMHFPVPVHRFPFSLPAALTRAHVPWEARRHDVAFVGSGTMGGGAYGRRSEVLTAMVEVVGHHRAFVREGVTPAELATAYADARLVPNDCGTRHRPITMRVFEAVNAGAMLVTEDAPGLDRLFVPGRHVTLLAEDAGEQARALLAARDTAERAAAATAHGRRHHATRHRVDQLLAVVAGTTAAARWRPPVPDDPLLAPVADDLLLDDVLPLGVADRAAVEEQLPDRTVWEPARMERLGDRPLAHAVVVGPGFDGSADGPARAARRLVVVAAEREDVLAAVLHRHPAAVVRSRSTAATVVDLGTPGYRIAPEATS